MLIVSCIRFGNRDIVVINVRLKASYVPLYNLALHLFSFTMIDNYEVVDSSLQDLKRALFPSYNPEDIRELDTNKILATDVHGVKYLPGNIYIYII